MTSRRPPCELKAISDFIGWLQADMGRRGRTLVNIKKEEKNACMQNTYNPITLSLLAH